MFYLVDQYSIFQDLAMEADSSETERIKPLKVDKSSAESDPSDIARNLLGMLCLGHGAVKADDEGTTLTVFQLPRLVYLLSSRRVYKGQT